MFTRARVHKTKETSNRQSRGEKATRLSNDPAAALQRAHALPASNLSANDILALQRTVGNRAVQQLLSSQTHSPLASATTPRPVIQAKLMVGPAADHYEQEADRIARKVTSDSASESGAESIQRQTDEEEAVQRKPLADSITPLVQRQPEKEDEEPVQAKRDGSPEGFVADGQLESRLQANRGNGSPLPEPLRLQMESRFGADFSRVRVHTDTDAADMNREVRAKAFTHGRDIFFKPDAYDPGSQQGKQLLAHELTHVVQQGGAAINSAEVRRKVSVSQSSADTLQRADDDDLAPAIFGLPLAAPAAPVAAAAPPRPSLLSRIGSGLRWLGRGIGSGASSLVSGIGSGLSWAGRGIASGASSLASGIGSGLSWAGRGIASGASSLGRGIVSGVGLLGRGIASGASAIGSGLSWAGRGIASGASTLGRGIVSGASSLASGIGSGLSWAGRGIASGASTLGRGIVSGVGLLGSGLSWAGRGIASGASTIGSGLSWAASGIGSGLSWAGSKVGSLFRGEHWQGSTTDQQVQHTAARANQASGVSSLGSGIASLVHRDNRQLAPELRDADSAYRHVSAPSLSQTGLGFGAATGILSGTSGLISLGSGVGNVIGGERVGSGRWLRRGLGRTAASSGQTFSGMASSARAISALTNSTTGAARFFSAAAVPAQIAMGAVDFVKGGWGLWKTRKSKQKLGQKSEEFRTQATWSRFLGDSDATKRNEELAEFAEFARDYQSKRQKRKAVNMISGALGATGGAMMMTGVGLIPGLAVAAAGGLLKVGAGLYGWMRDLFTPGDAARKREREASMARLASENLDHPTSGNHVQEMLKAMGMDRSTITSLLTMTPDQRRPYILAQLMRR
jgi:uncharacterized protein DUF4157